MLPSSPTRRRFAPATRLRCPAPQIFEPSTQTLSKHLYTLILFLARRGRFGAARSCLRRE